MEWVLRSHLNINAISNLINESGGCEPEFALSYTRKTEGLNGGEDVYYKVYCRAAREYMEKYKTDILPEYFVSAEDIPWLDRVKTQAAMQKHVDTAISSTINLPFTATKEDVAGIYLESWKRGIKGITIFRSGCNRAPILSKEKPEETPAAALPAADTLPRGHIVVTSDHLVGKKRKLITGCGSLHVAAFFDPVTGDLMETYLSKGSSGGCNNYMTGLSRMISLAARSGCGVEAIIDQLNSCGTCPSYAVRKATKHDTSRGSCCPTAVGNALLEMWNEMQDELPNAPQIHLPEQAFEVHAEDSCTQEEPDENHCPVCGAPIAHVAGCIQCTSCLWSRCGG